MIDAVYRAESRRVLATLIRLRGGSNSQRSVCPGRFKALDAMRRRARSTPVRWSAERLEAEAMRSIPGEGEDIEDDRLRLIFTCCQPLRPRYKRQSDTPIPG